MVPIRRLCELYEVPLEYRHREGNPIHHLVRMLDAITAEPLDEGSEHFQATTLQITSIDVGNPATNVIPGEATARFNVRFNDLHSGEQVIRWVRERLDREGVGYELDARISGESFLCPPNALGETIAEVVEAVTGRRPELSTTGGTSDARFIKDYCPVAEFGLVGQTMHKVDERTALSDIETLTKIYRALLDKIFP